MISMVFFCEKEDIISEKTWFLVLQRMDARFDTFNDELYQVNTHVDHIARWQAHLGGFVESPSPSPEASKDDDDDFDDDNDDDNGDASSPSNDGMSA